MIKQTCLVYFVNCTTGEIIKVQATTYNISSVISYAKQRLHKKGIDVTGYKTAVYILDYLIKQGLPIPTDETILKTVM